VITVNYESLSVPPPEPGPLDWNDDGFVLRKGLLSDEVGEKLMSEYEECWIKNNGAVIDGSLVMLNPGGWSDCTPYRRHPELMSILMHGPISEQMRQLIGEPAAVHLNLTGWKSTTRDWHQDTYLNPPHVGDYYVAVWIALEDIHPDSGPFQFVRGSHRWPVVTREKILEALPREKRDHRWPTYSEDILTPIFTEEIEKRKAEVVTHLPQRGDVLFWHSRLVHRGSVPNDKKMTRRALIAHYSGINHRSDMPAAVKNGTGWYFPIDGGNVGRDE
jgi:ectoine hydroxylase-related dioxygenase (phytanoyl-CoA dioxygenase family)